MNKITKKTIKIRTSMSKISRLKKKTKIIKMVKIKRERMNRKIKKKEIIMPSFYPLMRKSMPILPLSWLFKAQDPPANHP
jgi:hypothetical protein